jgi:hypothetical protein
MRIVSGSGNNRTTLDFPCSEIVKRSSDAEQKSAKTLLCSLLKVKETVDVSPVVA